MTEEGKLQSKIIKYAESKGVFVIKHMKCNVNGFPDLQLFIQPVMDGFTKPGEIVFFECKTPSGELSEVQKAIFLKLITGYYQYVYVIDSYEEAEKIIDTHLDPEWPRHLQWGRVD